MIRFPFKKNTIAYEKPNFPETENVAFALQLDFKKKTETIYIGEFENIKRMVRTGCTDGLLCEYTRELGTFLKDFKKETKDFWGDVKVLIIGREERHFYRLKYELENVYENKSENPIMQYMVLKLWEEYLRNRKSGFTIEDSLNRSEALTLPFRYDFMHLVKHYQRYMHVGCPFFDAVSELQKEPTTVMYRFKIHETKEFAITTGPLSSLIVYYLNMIYSRNRCISFCKVCGKLFFPRDVKKTTMCSKACKEVQTKRNKERYESRHKNQEYEKIYNRERAYWKYRLDRMKKAGIDAEPTKKWNLLIRCFC